MKNQNEHVWAKAAWGTPLAMLLLVGCASSNDGGGGGDAQGAGQGGISSAGTGGRGGAGTSSYAGAAGNQSKGGGGGAEDTSIEAACTAYGKAFCQTLSSCLLRIGNQYASPSACADASRDECLASFEANGGWTVAQQEACTSTYSATSCGLLYHLDPACKRPPGPKKSGASCLLSVECGAGMTCLSAAGSKTSCGVCRPDAKLGQACGTTAVCEDGLRCNGVCYEPASEGEGCYADKLCAFPLTCGATGEPCHEPSPLGASCGPVVDDCDQLNGLACHPVSNICKAVPFTSPAGAPCGYDSKTGDTTDCAPGLRCSGSDIKVATCKQPLKAGQACEVDPKTGRNPCGSGLYCIGKCVTAVEASCP